LLKEGYREKDPKKGGNGGTKEEKGEMEQKCADVEEKKLVLRNSKSKRKASD